MEREIIKNMRWPILNATNYLLLSRMGKGSERKVNTRTQAESRSPGRRGLVAESGNPNEKVRVERHLGNYCTISTKCSGDG
jgi:hypothetical protein